MRNFLQNRFKKQIFVFLLMTAFSFMIDPVIFSPSFAVSAIDPPPTFSKRFMADPVPVDIPVTLEFMINNSASSVDATNLDFTDTLPAGIVIANPANASTTAGCIGGTLTAVPGTSTISYTGGSVSPPTVCRVEVDIVSSTAGDYTNTSGSLTSSLGNSGTASDTLRVDPHPSFSKSFSPNSIAIGELSTLTFTIDNTASTSATTSLNFTDNLPAGVVVASPANATNTCGALSVLTATPGTGTISLAFGELFAGAACSISVDVTSSTPDAHVNTTGDLTYAYGNCGTATDTLTVTAPPQADLSITKTDSADPVAPGDNLTYTITVTNNGPDTADNVVVIDTLPAGVVLAATAGCAEDPAGVATCTLGSIAAGANKQYTIDVAVDSRTLGTITNQATVTSDATDPVPGNDSITEDTNVVAPAPPVQPTPQRYRLSVIKTGDGDGTVQNIIAGIDCGPDCVQYYNATTTITLSATPEEGSTFEGWSGTCPGTSSCVVNLTGDITVTAVFNKIDSDGDGTPDESDRCPDDPDKTNPGDCGCGMTDADNNQNGIADCLDTDDDNIPDDLDMDGNNIPDQDQDDMWVVSDGTGNVYFGAVVPTGVQLESLEWVDPSTIDDTTNRPDELPLGLMSFSLLTENPGDTVKLTIYCSEPIPEDASWYKYDPVYGWYDFSDYVVVSEDRMSVTLTIEDGGFGDGDGEVNGVIDDPSGPGLFIVDDTTDDTPTAKKGSSGSSGCFLKALTIN